MRVVHLYDGHERVHRGRGSVPGVVWNVARETAAAGHDVTVVERRWDGLPATATHEGVRFRRLSLRTGPDEPWTQVPYEQVGSPSGVASLVTDRTNFALRALALLRSLDYDLLHVHLPFAANVLVTVAPWLRDRLVYTAHLGELRLDAVAADGDGGEGTVGDTADSGGNAADSAESADPTDATNPADPAETDGGLSVPAVLRHLSPDEYLVRRAARTTVLNPAIRDAFVDRGVPPERLRVVPNGVDLDRFDGVGATERERVRERYGLTGSRVLLFVGTVMPRKGVLDLVQATAAVVREDWPVGRAADEADAVGERADDLLPDGGPGGRADVTLVVAGEAELDGGYVDRVHRAVEAAGIDEQVLFPGFVPEEDLPALYDLAEVFVLPSKEEGFGMTALESMAAGTPVVATRVGGLPRLVDHGENGLLADVGDVDALARHVDRLLAAPDERDRMGELARERAAEYGWAGIADRFVDVYRGVA